MQAAGEGDLFNDLHTGMSGNHRCRWVIAAKLHASSKNVNLQIVPFTKDEKLRFGAFVNRESCADVEMFWTKLSGGYRAAMKALDKMKPKAQEMVRRSCLPPDGWRVGHFAPSMRDILNACCALLPRGSVETCIPLLVHRSKNALCQSSLIWIKF